MNASLVGHSWKDVQNVSETKLDPEKSQNG